MKLRAVFVAALIAAASVAAADRTDKPIRITWVPRLDNAKRTALNEGKLILIHTMISKEGKICGSG